MNAKRPLLVLSLLLAWPATLAVAQVGAVQRVQRIQTGTAGFVGPLPSGGHFGWSLAALGDLDGDGVGDLAVGSVFDGDGGTRRGAVWILFLRADGSVRGEQKISQTRGGFGGTLANQGMFGRELARVGDLDGDGVTELAVLSGRPNRVWILFLGPDGTVRRTVEIQTTDPAFQPPTTAQDFLEGGLAALGDVDGDGLDDLVLGAPRDPDGAHEAGAIWILRLRADGTLAGTHKISQLHGGFTGELEEEAYFGQALLPPVDLDGDGGRELLVSAGYFDDGVWVLQLDDDERVVSQRRFDRRDYGLDWLPLFPWLHPFASSSQLAWLGDLDGDGTSELAMGFPTENWPGGSHFEGGFAIGFLRPDGSVKRRLRISHGRAGLGELPPQGLFGFSFAPLGDLDGDGAQELAVGGPTLDDHRGAVWILSLAPTAVRNGSGVNPVILSQAAEPVFGTTWSATLDCSGQPGGLAVLWGFSQPTSGVFTPFGELLVTGQRLFRFEAVGARNPVRFTGTVPPSSIALLDLSIHVQGLCAGANGARLSNALGVLLGQ